MKYLPPSFKMRVIFKGKLLACELFLQRHHCGILVTDMQSFLAQNGQNPKACELWWFVILMAGIMVMVPSHTLFLVIIHIVFLVVLLHLYVKTLSAIRKKHELKSVFWLYLPSFLKGPFYFPVHSRIGGKVSFRVCFQLESWDSQNETSV